MIHAIKNNLINIPRGKNHFAYGKKGKFHAASKPLIDIETGVFYDSCVDASEILGINYSTLTCMLAGHDRNRTNLRYA